MNDMRPDVDQGTSVAGAKGGLSTSTKVIIGILLAVVVFGIIGIISLTTLLSATSKKMMNKQFDSSYDWNDEDDDSGYDYPADFGIWQIFYDDLDRFSMELPGSPDRETSSTPIPGSDISVEYDIYSTEDENAFYTVTIAEYPAAIDLGEPEINLQNALNGLLASSAASLISSEMTTVQGNTALHYIAQTADGFYLEGKSIVQEQALYQLMVAYGNEELTADQRAKFFDSFLMH